MGKQVFCSDMGIINYQQAWDLQKQLSAELVDRKVRNRKLPETEQEAVSHYFLFCQHPHVYTLGRNGSESNLLLNEKGLEKQQATFVKINRGGDITYHGYGQIVGYPILDMDAFFNDIGRYVRFVEEMIIRTLADYGLQGNRIKGLSGVWLDSETAQARKICAVGMHFSRWVSMHGFAFNVNTDLSYFNHIVPCGINDKGVTSMEKELGRKIDLDELKPKILKHFSDIFNAQVILKERVISEPKTNK